METLQREYLALNSVTHTHLPGPDLNSGEEDTEAVLLLNSSAQSLPVQTAACVLLLLESGEYTYPWHLDVIYQMN